MVFLVRSVCEGVFFFSSFVLVNLGRLVDGFNLRDKFCERGNDIVEYRNLGFNNFIDVFGLDFEVNDIILVFSSSSFGSGSEGLFNY